MLKLIVVGIILIIVIGFFRWASLCLDKRLYKKLLIISMLIYGCVVLYLTLFSRPYHPRTPDFIPFHWLWRFIKWSNFLNLSTVLVSIRSAFFTVSNYLLNIMLFIPLGYLGPEIWRKKSCKTVVLRAFLSSVLIEISQLVCSLGYFEVDDLIANSLGAYVGWFLWERFLRNKNM